MGLAVAFPSRIVLARRGRDPGRGGIGDKSVVVRDDLAEAAEAAEAAHGLDSARGDRLDGARCTGLGSARYVTKDQPLPLKWKEPE